MTRHPKTQAVTWLAVLLLGGLGVLCADALSQSETQTDANEMALSLEGKATFNRYCRTCHGEDARGDGPVAEYLRERPADLTKLSAKNQGVFPFERVTQAIDGRRDVGVHGPREMPVWGDALRSGSGEPGEDAMVKRKIEELAYYLKSIQEPGSP